MQCERIFADYTHPTQPLTFLRRICWQIMVSKYKRYHLISLYPVTRDKGCIKVSDSPQQYYLHPATTVLRSSGSVWTMNLAYLLLEYLLCLIIYPSSDHLTLCTVVTRVCCGSQDPTDCWPGKAGTGSRQQQLPGGFPLYFPAPTPTTAWPRTAALCWT